MQAQLRLGMDRAAQRHDRFGQRLGLPQQIIMQHARKAPTNLVRRAA
jgi:hypothetical protein